MSCRIEGREAIDACRLAFGTASAPGLLVIAGPFRPWLCDALILDRLLSLSAIFFVGSVAFEELRSDCVATLPTTFETERGL